MKLGAKRAGLVQKFVPRSHIEIFHNEHTQSNPLNPKLTFWCISYYLGAFGTVWLPYETRWKMGRTSAKVRATMSRRNFSERTHPITSLDPKLMFWCISYHLGVFETVWLPYETRWKTGRTSANVRATKRVRIFRSERTRSTLFDTKLTFWCISYHLGAFGTIWLSYETRCKWAELVQKFVPRSRVGIFHNERTRSTPLEPKLIFWCVPHYLGPFGTIWLH